MASEESLRYQERMALVTEQIAQRINAVSVATAAEIERCATSADPIDMARAYVILRTFKEAIDESWKKIAAALAELASDTYPNLLQTRGLKSVPLEDLGRTVGMSVRIKASVIADKKDAAYGFLLKDENTASLVVPHVFPQTLSSYAKELAEQGRELPEELFNVFEQLNTTWRRLT